MKLKPAVVVAALALTSSLGAWALVPLKPTPASSFATVANGSVADAWAFNPGAESLLMDHTNFAAYPGSEIAKLPTKLSGGPLLLGTEVAHPPLGRPANTDPVPVVKAGTETYIVLLAGLGAIGFLARRRRSD